ncbi:glycoside hydrolase family 44 protein [Tengunoibacter tsumagoiensis]|uniref:BIG2 domain-containing protein n=1 Tax=Tengunoibacter tsumagoiensis TaxID=2014871 RepID=A0A402A700_9CHLR|nr:glycoside hydrolase family 44 protein [Tengunoibacter tsumagoiensis]GCE14771.1 hypothetical protein KTT_46300 [Tengunoibacter tsumagoiensis]
MQEAAAFLTRAECHFYFNGGNGTSNPVPGAGADAMITQDETTNASTVLTIPLIGYVNKTSEWNCSYPESLYPNQQAYNPYIHPNGDNCGNGKDASGNNLTDTNIGLNYTTVDSTWMKAWIQHLVQAHGTAAAGGVPIYQMDNEPESWSNVHYDVHPSGTGFDEYLNKTIDYASMIKSVDPTAQILGPSSWGVPAYFDMGLAGDNEASHNQAWIPYYLQQLYQYQQQHNQRLLNYLDVHFYAVQANNANEDPASDAQRLRSTRSLWDPTYTEESWIGQYFTPAEQVQLIPRLRTWVKQYYPGTKTALTEYNFGDVNGINGALAQADALGIFGREGLDLATMWGAPNATDAAANSFRFYRNFDGNGGQYGDTWVQSTSTDQGQLSIYGAQRSLDHALTFVVINKTGNDLTSNLSLANFTPDANAHVYQYTGSNLSSIVQQPDQAVSASGFSYTYPANSITEFVLPQQGTPYVGGANSNPAPSLKNSLQPDVPAYSLYVGQTYPTTVTCIDGNGVGTPVVNGVSFASDNPTVATVDSNGVVTGKAIGTAHITGTSNGEAFTVTVTIIGVQSITLAPAAVTLPVGAQNLDAVTANYSDSTTQPIAASSVTYASDNQAVATVDANGIVTAKRSGIAHISAAVNGLSATQTVTVPATYHLPGGWKQQDIGAVATAGNVAYSNGVYDVTGAGTDVYGDQDQGHFVYRELPHNGTLIARITAVKNVQGYAGGGLMVRDGLSTGANLVYLAMFPNGSVQVKAGSATAKNIGGVWGGNANNSFPYWVKLDRTGDVITASISPDGQVWTQVAQVPFSAAKSYIGLFVTAHGAPIMNTSTFDNVSFTNGKSTVPGVSGHLPSGWQKADVGAVAAPANAGYHNGTFTLQAAGADVYGTTDQSGFIYRTLPGDGTITAHVATQGNTNDYAKSGLMLRDSLQSGANTALLAITPLGAAQLTTGSSTASSGLTNVWTSSANTFAAPYWLRLQRSGGTVTAFTSPDGQVWTQQAQISFPTGSVYIGLEVDSHASFLFGTSTFDHVALS